jgi:hypothetical protein
LFSEEGGGGVIVVVVDVEVGAVVGTKDKDEAEDKEAGANDVTVDNFENLFRGSSFPRILSAGRGDWRQEPTHVVATRIKTTIRKCL